MSNFRIVLASVFLSLLSGCGSTGLRLASYADSLKGQERPQAGYNEMRRAATSLLDGIQLYERGDYNKAIAKLSLPEIEDAPVVFRVEALKYTAFSYCLIERYERCRQVFDQAFGIDADFKLVASEGGHPMWGPVYEAAKAASEKARQHEPKGERARWRGIDPWRPK